MKHLDPTRRFLILCALFVAGGAGGALALHEIESVPLGLPAEALAQRTPDPAQVALGERLFFDPLLSADRSISCASCHKPEHGFADTAARSQGVEGRLTLRNTPTILNRALGETFLWDGRAGTLEQQVLLPIQNELEMDLSLKEAVRRLAADPASAEAFEVTFGGPPTESRLASSLAAFVRSKLTGNSRVDRFQAGERDVLSAEERAGAWIFEGAAGCWKCHSGPNFTDEGFHNTGVSLDDQGDTGRFAITGEEADRGRFKTPTLRALAHTAPYMHDGSLATLAEVVEFYRKGGGPNSNLDARLRALELSDAQALNLVAFLEALSE